MKIPLRYQLTEYDCGSTSVENAIAYLFNRNEIPPIVVKHIMIYCMDSFNSKGEFAKGGTSRMAMNYLSEWLNNCSRTYKFPIHCEYLTGDAVCVSPQSPLIGCLRHGGVVVLRVRYGCWHYVLLTGADKQYVHIFDPYFRKKSFASPEIQIVSDRPMQMNRKVPYSFLNAEHDGVYAMGPKPMRDAILLFNTHKTRCDPLHSDGPGPAMRVDSAVPDGEQGKRRMVSVLKRMGE